jgi:peptide/nickel transport system substrate-binding protein
VPQKPSNPYISTEAKNNPYPYSPDHAKELLSDHGWDVSSNGVTTCKSPGTGPSNCGEGIDAGTKLEFSLQYNSATEWVARAMQALQSSAAQVGIKLDLSSAPFNTIISNVSACSTGGSCSWDLGNWGGGWIYGVNPVPTGDQIFLTGAGGNFGQYSDPTNDANIKATTQVAGNAPIVKYQNYLAKQLPVVFMPLPVYQLSLISSKLKGATPQIPILGLAPEDWRLSS